jgi:hypothetical protein
MLKKRFIILFSLVLFISLMAIILNPALLTVQGASVHEVTNGNDSGEGSLRQAVSDARDGDTITFASGVTTVTLTSGEIVISGAIQGSITIDGGAGVTITKNPTSNFRIIRAQNSDKMLTLKNLTLENGNIAQAGGGLYVSGMDLILENCTFRNNISTPLNANGGGGGGVLAYQSISAKNCTFIDNSSIEGGGLWANKITLIENCTFKDNTANTNGGGLFSLCIDSIPVRAKNCIFIGNKANSYGGGLYANENLLMVNCIVSDNTAREASGIFSAGPVLVNCTVVYNTTTFVTSGAIYGGSNNMWLYHCTVAGNEGGYALMSYYYLYLYNSLIVANYRNYSGNVVGGSNIIGIASEIDFYFDIANSTSKYLIPWDTVPNISNANLITTIPSSSPFQFDVLLALDNDICGTARITPPCTYGAVEGVNQGDIIVKFSVINNTGGTLTSEASDTGNITSLVTPINPGENIIFTATPASGYHVKEWQINGQRAGSINMSYTINNINSRQVVTVEYEPNVVTLSIFKNSESWSDNTKIFTLRQSGTTVIGVKSGATVTFSNVPNGVYNIYDGSEDTGVTVTVDNENVTKRLDYYSIVFLPMAHAGSENDNNCLYESTTITATYDGKSVLSGTVVLGGKEFVATMTGSGAKYYFFIWHGSAPGDEWPEGHPYRRTISPVNYIYSINTSPYVNAPVNLGGCANRAEMYDVTLEIYKDGVLWNDHGKNFQLKWDAPDDFPRDFPMSGSSTGVIERVYRGAYVINEITGSPLAATKVENAVVADDDVTVKLYYYTINFSVIDAGFASGSTISATYGGEPIADGAIVKSGKILVITAVGSGADYYTYDWNNLSSNGLPTPPQDSEKPLPPDPPGTLTIYLSGKVDVECTVTGYKEKYSVTVINGGSDGDYYAGDTVTISADPPPPGQRFKDWVFSPGVTFANGTNANSTTASFTMPAQNVMATATHEPIPPSQYIIIVMTDGNGVANANVNSATQGTQITLTATANSGYKLKEWQVISGGVTLSSSINSTATFQMPDNDVEIKAIFDEITQPPTTEPPTTMSTTESATEPTTETITSLEDITEPTVEATEATESTTESVTEKTTLSESTTEPTGETTETGDETSPTNDSYTELVKPSNKPTKEIDKNMIESLTTESKTESILSEDANFSEENLDDTKISLTNGWFAEYNKDGIWHIFDGNGNPIGEVIVPNGVSIFNYDVAGNLIPLAELNTDENKINPPTSDKFPYVYLGSLILIIASVVVFRKSVIKCTKRTPARR